MKAFESAAVYNKIHNRKKFMEIHRQRVKSAKPMISSRLERPGSDSPRKRTSKKTVLKQEKKDKILKNNLLLAQRIFAIMEGPGIISNIMEKKYENHPGTINFPHRLEEAKRIHKENMILAARLDSVKPYYDTTALTLVRPPMHKSPVSGSQHTHTSPRQHPPNSKILIGKNTLTLEDLDSNGNSSHRPKNVLLEYTKIQHGHVLDVAVLKEPYRDRFAIFGIDINEGHRYELRLTSEDVSNILDGDILVTSTDNVEVWMALLNKVELQPVEEFAKFPGIVVDAKTNNSISVESSLTSNQDESLPKVSFEESSSLLEQPIKEEGYYLDEFYDDHKGELEVLDNVKEISHLEGIYNDEEVHFYENAEMFDINNRPSARVGSSRADTSPKALHHDEKHLEGAAPSSAKKEKPHVTIVEPTAPKQSKPTKQNIRSHRVTKPETKQEAVAHKPAPPAQQKGARRPVAKQHSKDQKASPKKQPTRSEAMLEECSLIAASIYSESVSAAMDNITRLRG